MATIKGGDKLEKAFTQLAARLSKPGTLRVGFLEKATYPDGKPVAMIAAIQNYGSGHIPPRPFFSNMVRSKSKDWPKALAPLLKANDYDATLALRLMGEGIKGQLQQSIRDTNTPPLAPSTIARKGFDKPLIDTGHMINSVDYEVVG